MPPSRPCEEKDLDGALWQLKRVYEEPLGQETNDFTTSPTQFIFFQHDKTFAIHKSPYAEASDDLVKQKMARETQGLQQFVLGANGALYFYRDGVASQTQICFIVANRKQPFYVGEMLLMPPANQQATAGRMVKVYDRHGTAPRKHHRHRRKPRKRGQNQ